MPTVVVCQDGVSDINMTFDEIYQLASKPIRDLLNVSIDDVENAFALMVPHRNDSFPRNPQNESHKVHEIMRFMTREHVFSCAVGQMIFYQHGTCVSYN